MTQKWYNKATVQAAMVAGILGGIFLLGGVIGTGIIRSLLEKKVEGQVRVDDVIVQRRNAISSDVDFRLTNSGDKAISISRVQFKAVKIQFPESSRGPAQAEYLAPSQNYSLDISNLESNSQIECVVSQVIAPGQSDRIIVTLFRNSDLAPAIMTLNTSLVTSGGDLSAKQIEVKFKD